MKSETGHSPSIDEVSNRLAIQEVLVTHSRGLDRADLPTLRSAYWPEAQVDYGSFKGLAYDFAVEVLPALQERYAATQHKIGTISIMLRGARAHTETYVTAHHLLADEPKEMIFHGRYLDLLEERSAVWKILRRRVVMDWHRIVAVDADPNDEVLTQLTKGRHDERDVSLPFFAEI